MQTKLRPISLALLAALVLLVAWRFLAGPTRPEAPPEAGRPQPPTAGKTESEGLADPRDSVQVRADGAEGQRSAGLSGLVMDLSRGADGSRPIPGARVELRLAETIDTAVFQGDRMRALDHAVALSIREPDSTAPPPWKSWPVDYTAFTDAEGRFALEGLPSGTWISIRIVEEGFLAHHRSGMLLSPGESRKLGRIDLLRPGVLTGSVVDPGGHPVPRAVVSLESNPIARCDREGKFRIDGLRSGVILLSADHPGQLAWSSRKVPVVVRANELTRGVVLTVGRGVAVPGSVSDEQGAPLAGALIAASGGDKRGPMTLAAEDGRFTLWLPPGDFPAVIEASLTGYASAFVVLEPWEVGRPLGLELQRKPRILLTVQDADTGTAVEVSDVTLGAHPGWEGSPIPFLMKDDLCQIPYDEDQSDSSFYLHAEGYTSTSVEIRTEHAGDPLPERVSMRRLPALSGSVDGEGRGAVSGAFVRTLLFRPTRLFEVMFVPSVVPGPRTWSDANGHFALDVGYFGKGVLVVEADGYTRETRPFDLDPSRSGAFEGERSPFIRLFAAAQLEGVVTGFDGQPAAGESVAAFDTLPGETTPSGALQQYHATRTDARGYYRFDHLTPAFHTVLVGPDLPAEQSIQSLRGLPSGPDSRRTRLIPILNREIERSVYLEEVAVPPGEPVRLDIDLRKRFGSIRGIAYLNDEPLEGAAVRLTRARSSTDVRHRQTAPGGTFRFTMVPPGEYSLIVVRDGLPLGEAVTVPLGINQHRNLAVHCKTGLVRGQVVGESHASVTLRLERILDRGPVALGNRVLVDASGWFSERGLALGEYQISGSGPGVLIPDHQFTVDGSEGAAPLLLETRPAARVTLLPDPRSRRDSSYRISLETAGGRPYRPRVVRRPDGSLLLPALPPGVSSLRVVRSFPPDRRGWETWWWKPRLSRIELDLHAGTPSVYSLSLSDEVDDEP